MQQKYRVLPGSEPISGELIQLLAQVETATVGHFEHLGFVGAGVLPVFPARTAGKAVTLAAPGRDGHIIYMAIDLLVPGDVLVIARVDRDDIACVGGGVATAAKARGAAAIVIDGPCTDMAELREVGLPVWCRGTSAKTTSREFQIGGSVNVPVACGGAAVLPGYAVLADPEGVYVADAAHMREVALIAIERQKRSAALRPHLAAGRSALDLT